MMQPVGCCQNVIIKTQKKKPCFSTSLLKSPTNYMAIVRTEHVRSTEVAFYLMFIFKERFRRFYPEFALKAAQLCLCDSVVNKLSSKSRRKLWLRWFGWGRVSGLEVRREAWGFILSLLPFVHPMFPFSTVTVGVSLMLRVKFKAVDRLGLRTSY